MKETPIEERLDLYKLAVERWGVESQIRMGIEECAELIVELAKLNRAHNGTDEYNVACEIADVELCVEQIKEILRIGKIVSQVREEKLNRFRELLGVEVSNG